MPGYPCCPNCHGGHSHVLLWPGDDNQASGWSTAVCTALHSFYSANGYVAHSPSQYNGDVFSYDLVVAVLLASDPSWFPAGNITTWGDTTRFLFVSEYKISAGPYAAQHQTWYGNKVTTSGFPVKDFTMYDPGYGAGVLTGADNLIQNTNAGLPVPYAASDSFQSGTALVNEQDNEEAIWVVVAAAGSYSVSFAGCSNMIFNATLASVNDLNGNPVSTANNSQLMLNMVEVPI